MAEQLALEHLPRDRRAVERHERLVGARGVTMDGAGQDLLAGAAFAGDEDVDVDRRHLAGERHHLAELSEHHRLLAVLRRFLQGPQRQSFLALGVRALEVSNRAEEEGDRIRRGDRLDVGAKLDSDFHRRPRAVPMAKTRSDRPASASPGAPNAASVSRDPSEPRDTATAETIAPASSRMATRPVATSSGRPA